MLTPAEAAMSTPAEADTGAEGVVFVLVEVVIDGGAPDLSAEVAVVKSLTFATLVEGRALKLNTNISWSSSSPYTKKSENGRQKDLPGIVSNVQRGCRVSGTHIKSGLVGVRSSGRRGRRRLALARA